MESFKLEGQVRSKLGKTSSAIERKGDLVPCVLYGNNENINFTVDVSVVLSSSSYFFSLLDF